MSAFECPDLAPGDKKILSVIGRRRPGLDDICVHEDSILPLRIYVLMNDRWDIYDKVVNKVDALQRIKDEKVLRSLYKSVKSGWKGGHIDVSYKNKKTGWHVVHGRHRYACCYTLGINVVYIKLRPFKEEYYEGVFVPSKNIPIMNLIPAEIANILKRRHKILQVLKSIPHKRGLNHTFSAYQHMPELGIRGENRYNIDKISSLIKGKTVLDFMSCMGMSSMLMADHAKKVFSFERDSSYRQIASIANGYYKKDIEFINTKEDCISVAHSCDVMVVPNYMNCPFTKISNVFVSSNSEQNLDFVSEYL